MPGDRGGGDIVSPLPQILMDQLTWSQPGANKIATRTFGFLDLPRALNEAGYVRAGNPGADILQ